MDDAISRQAAIDALWKALYAYEDKKEKQFQESEDLDIQDWIQHRIFVQNMSDIDRQTILALPPVQPNHNADPGKMEIVRCKDCKHWNLQVGNVKGDGLGSCDFHNVNLVTGEGFCYWADRRGELEWKLQ